MGRSLCLAKRLAWVAPATVVVVACVDDSALYWPGPTPCTGSACDGGGGSVDSGIPDAAPDAATRCEPRDVGFTPKWRPPTGRGQGQCTTAQVNGFIDCLFGQFANDASCRDYVSRADNAVCARCLVSGVTDDAYGPFVRLGVDTLTVNVEGCVALATNDVSATGCGAKAQAIAQCRSDVCAPNCPLTDHASLLAYNACESAADLNVCKSYIDPAACILPLLDGVAAPCARAPTPLEAARYVATYFCAIP